MNKLALFLIPALLLAACGELDEDTSGETGTVTATDGTKADGSSEVRVRAAEMTIWGDRVLRTEREGWRLDARCSYDLADVSATLDGTEVDVRQTSDRKFRVILDAEQIAANLEGTPLFVDLETTSGKRRNVMFTTRARTRSSGSYRIYPWKNIEPVVVGGETMFRGRLTVRGDIESLEGLNDDDSEPTMRQEDAEHWVADFPSYALPWAAHPTDDPVVFVAEDADGERYSRDVKIVMEVYRLGVSSDAPHEAWPAPTCSEDIRRCVGDRGRDADLEACGAAAEVHPCLAELPGPDNADELKQAFADGLRSALLDHYAEHEEEIVDSGGNPRTEALRMVDTAEMDEVLDPQEVPSGHDLEEYRVFRHPDVTFPGSDIVWFGVFDRDDELVDVFDFN